MENDIYIKGTLIIPLIFPISSFYAISKIITAFIVVNTG